MWEQRKDAAGNWREMDLRFIHDKVVNSSQRKAEAVSRFVQGATRATWA